VLRVDLVIASQDAARRRRRLTGGAARLGEAALVRAAQQGSEEAVEQLFARHWDAAYRAALLVTGDRAAAEDIAQEAFLAALRALPRFDVRRALRPWLHRIVVNRAIDWSRARAARREVGAEVAPEPVAAGDAGGAPFDEAIVAALQQVSVEHRAVLVMRYVLELTPGEIARALELPRGTVNSRLRRGLDALREILEAESASATAPGRATPRAGEGGRP
jgi:RNA polymerase sigma-70 factor (ECF subfamily)